MTERSSTPLRCAKASALATRLGGSTIGIIEVTHTAWITEDARDLIIEALRTFARSESAFIEVGEMVEIPDGFDGHPNTVYCEWNEMRSKLPAGTKIYVRR